MNSYRRALLAPVAIVALVAGSLVYLADRPPVVMVPASAMLATGPLFGVVGQWLPSFVHPFAFSLLTAAAGGSRATPAYSACWMWWVINVAFEAGQHPWLREPIATGIDGALGDTWPARLVSNYFSRGTFDPGDIVAVTLGAMAAAVILRRVHSLENRHGQ